MGLELEGLSPEDSEFAAAKQYVRFAGAAVKNAHDAGPTGDPAKQAREAAMEAARLHAPGFMDLHGEPSAEQSPKQNDGTGQTGPSQRAKGESTMESFEHGQPGSSGGYAATRNGRGLSEEQQMDLASQLMELESEAEFEGLYDTVLTTLGAGDWAKSPTGVAVKQGVKAALPIIAGTVGSHLPGVWGPLVQTALPVVADALEAEAEAEERDWETANVIVRVILGANDNAARAPRHADPHEVAHHAITEAIRRHAPHALRAWSDPAHERRRGRHRHTGHWVREGHNIFVYGI